MRPSHLLLILLSPLLALAWSADDHEIFRLNDELRALEGTNATFYSFLTVSSTATSDEINKSYRTRSRTLHPDKAIRAAVSKLEKERAKQAGKLGKPSKASVTSKERQRIAKEANERYKRLPNIVAILRDHRRERYDYFLKNGFPAWRGTGYYYTRFRPGIGSVIAGLLLVFGGGMHYGAMYIGWKRRREFVERYVGHARRTAWGDDTGIPGLSDALNGTAGHNVEVPPPDTEQDGNIALNRKQKRMQEKESKREKNKPSRMARLSKSQEVEGASQTSSARKKVMAENGKVLIVDAEGNVFLQEETEEGDVHELLLDPDEIPPPSVFQTALFRLPVWLYAKTFGRALGSRSGADPNEHLVDQNDLTIDNPDAHSDEVLNNSASLNANADARKRKAKAREKK